MAQATVFPIRYGLPLPPPENIKAVEVFSEGGLDLTQSIIENRSGCASELINFEASLTGGYARILGYQPFDVNIVPGQGQVLGVMVAWPSYILAARQSTTETTKYNLYWSTGNGWTIINPVTTTQTGTTNATATVTVTNSAGLVVGQPVTSSSGDIPANTYILSITNTTTIVLTRAATASNTNETLTFHHPLNFTTGMTFQSTAYNWSGFVRNAIFDGVNFGMRWDPTNGLVIFTGTAAAPAPSNPQFGAEFQGYLVVGGFSLNFGAIAYCAPLADTDWASADGEATIVVGDTVTGLRVWRNNLIIFSKNGIKRMIPNSLNLTGITPPPQFQIQPVTDKIGCLEGRTIQEINGDLVYLAPDGIRTISGTFNIGDTEIGSISRPIQGVVSLINPTVTPCQSLVIHKKTQYRLFYPGEQGTSTKQGINGCVRRFRDGHEAWEWGELEGIAPACADSGYLSDNNEYCVHGGFDGFVYRQEVGNTFNGGAINESYTTVPLELGDIGLRKALQRVTTYISAVGGLTTIGGAPLNINLTVNYDYNAPNSVQPATYTLQNVGGVGTLYDSGADWDHFVWDAQGNTKVRQTVQGSGFVVKINVTASGIGIPAYVIQGYYIEFFPAGRR